MELEGGILQPIEGKREKEGTWQEGRRVTLQAVRSPINLLTMKISHCEAQKRERKEARKPVPSSLEERQYELIRVLEELSDSLQLSVGAPPGTCERGYPPYILSGYRTPYRKGVYEVDPDELELGFIEPEDGEEVVVLDPFIYDNLLHEQVQPLIVRPLSQKERIELQERMKPTSDEMRLYKEFQEPVSSS